MSSCIIPSGIIASLVVPDDRLQAEYFFRNCPYPVIDVAIRGSPEPRQSSALGITAIRGSIE